MCPSRWHGFRGTSATSQTLRPSTPEPCLTTEWPSGDEDHPGGACTVKLGWAPLPKTLASIAETDPLDDGVVGMDTVVVLDPPLPVQAAATSSDSDPTSQRKPARRCVCLIILEPPLVR